MLKDITIQSLATEVVYNRGCHYFKNGAVKKFVRSEKPRGQFCAVIAGSQDYQTKVRMSPIGDFVEDFECSCPAAKQYIGACKHVVALLKAVQAFQVEEAAQKTPPGAVLKVPSYKSTQYADGERMLKIFAADERSKLPPQKVRFEPSLFVHGRDALERHAWLEFRIGTEKTYLVKSVANIFATLKARELLTFGKNFILDTARLDFADDFSQNLFSFVKEYYDDDTSVAMLGNHYFGQKFFAGRQFRLGPNMLRRFLRMADGRSLPFVFRDREPTTVTVKNESPTLSLAVDEQDGGRVLFGGERGELLSGDGRIVWRGNTIFVADEAFAAVAKPLFAAFEDKSFVPMGEKNLGTFFGKVAPYLEKAAKISLSPKIKERYVIEKLAAEFYLSHYRDGLEVRPLFRYGDASVNPLESAAVDAESRIVVRDVQGERKLLDVFSAYGFFRLQDSLIQPDEEKSYDFFRSGLAELADSAEIFYDDSFLKKPVQTMPRITARAGVSDDNMLTLDFAADELDFDELIGILTSYRKKKRYYRLKDKSFITLEDDIDSPMFELLLNSGLKKGSDKAIMPLCNLPYVDALARDEEDADIERSPRFVEFAAGIRKPETTDIEPPRELNGTLRDYQRTGFCWLTNLANAGLGGILADDMGLGKTLQTIAFLLAKKNDVSPSLVVAPTSLMYNWLDEMERFAPSLKAAAMAGTKQEREKMFDTVFDDCDVIVTTYDMLKRDIELYEQKRFGYVILDEAQHIKNPATKNAKAVKRLNARGFFALTGTPIENTLTELWSIFDFLLPNYLSGYTDFKERYELPIMRDGSESAAKDLRRRISPFIMRRLKKDVLTELPDKVESRLLAPMTDEQAKIYRAWFMRSQKEFADALKESGFAESRIKILAILTRLRQIACDPSLFLEDYAGGSGKLEMLNEIVTEAVAGEHRLLIFSQFTSMLQKIAARLETPKTDCFYLDGTTPALKRLEMAKSFNGGAGKVFLISLKAGGTGLNLTGADMVIHFDPWWNPAVEDQATDRAYRIGQQKNVQVLKFIAKGTVEEKIYKIQESKKSLIDKMIKPGENFLSKLTEEEIRDLFK